jgi:hypothetical protein
VRLLRRLSVGLQVTAAIAALFVFVSPVVGALAAFIFGVAGLIVGAYVSKLKDEEVAINLRQVTESTTQIHERLAKVDPATRRRELTPDLRDHLIANLRIGPRGPVEVRPAKTWSDEEAHDFDHSLWLALKEAGWPVNDTVLDSGDEPNQQVGLSIRAYSVNGEPPRHAIRLRNCIQLCGIPVNLEISRSRDDQRVQLIVGRKPLY